MMQKKPLTLALLIALALAWSPGRGQGGRSVSLVFVHVTVIDATGVPAKPDMTVVISGERITAVGKTGKVKIQEGAQVVDAKGKFLIPELWDMHVHLWNDDKLLRMYVANGVTGVRDMGGDLERDKRWRDQAARGGIVGPRIVAAGPVVNISSFELPEWGLKTSVAKTEAEGRTAVGVIQNSGADFVKVISPAREAYFAVAAEARRRNIPFAGHVPDDVSALEASDAGQKSMEHLFGISKACSSREAELREKFLKAMAGEDWPSAWRVYGQFLDTYSEEKARALFSRFKRNGTWQVPTLTQLARQAFIYHGDPTADPRLRYVPLSIRNKWEPPEAARKKLSAAGQAAFRRDYETAFTLVSGMSRAGVGVMAGTDTGDPYTYSGFTLHEELALLVRAGLSPMEALQAATRNPAEFLGRLDSLGTVERGKLADLVLLDANPLQDIANTRKINAVVFGGRLFNGNTLREMLDSVESAAGKK